MLVVITFLGFLSFETRNRLNSCIEINYLFVQGELHFNQKPTCLAYLNLNIVFSSTFAHILFINFQVVAATQVMVKLGDTILSSKHLGITHKKSVIMSHVLLEGHNATYNNFSILIPKNSELK